MIKTTHREAVCSCLVSLLVLGLGLTAPLIGTAANATAAGGALNNQGYAIAGIGGSGTEGIGGSGTPAPVTGIGGSGVEGIGGSGSPSPVTGIGGSGTEGIGGSGVEGIGGSGSPPPVTGIGGSGTDGIGGSGVEGIGGSGSPPPVTGIGGSGTDGIGGSGVEGIGGSGSPAPVTGIGGSGTQGIGGSGGEGIGGSGSPTPVTGIGGSGTEGIGGSGVEGIGGSGAPAPVSGIGGSGTEGIGGSGSPDSVEAGSETVLDLLSAVRQRPLFEGRVDEIDSLGNYITILGQRLQIDQEWVRELAVGDSVAAFGRLSIDGSFLADRISIDDTTYVPGASAVTVSGFVDSVDVNRGMLQIGGLLIDYTSILSEAPNAAFHKGDLLRATGIQADLHGQLMASKITVIVR